MNERTPPASNEMPRTVIQDPSLAEEMAYAGKDHRELGTVATAAGLHQEAGRHNQRADRAELAAGRQYLATLHEQLEAGAGLSEEQLREGYPLGEYETVSFDVGRRPEQRGNRVKFGVKGNFSAPDAVHTATIRFGGKDPGNYAKAYIYDVKGGFVDSNNQPKSSRDSIVAQLIDANGHRTNQIWDLPAGEEGNLGLVQIGRKNQGQENLNYHVSSDHAAFGLKDGQLVVENHRPTNYTEVQRPVDGIGA